MNTIKKALLLSHTVFLREMIFYVAQTEFVEMWKDFLVPMGTGEKQVITVLQLPFWRVRRPHASEVILFPRKFSVQRCEVRPIFISVRISFFFIIYTFILSM